MQRRDSRSLISLREALRMLERPDDEEHGGEEYRRRLLAMRLGLEPSAAVAGRVVFKILLAREDMEDDIIEQGDRQDPPRSLFNFLAGEPVRDMTLKRANWDAGDFELQCQMGHGRPSVLATYSISGLKVYREVVSDLRRDSQISLSEQQRHYAYQRDIDEEELKAWLLTRDLEASEVSLHRDAKAAHPNLRITQDTFREVLRPLRPEKRPGPVPGRPRKHSCR